MKKLSSLLLLGISTFAFSQVMPAEEFLTLLNAAQEDCVGAHESAVLRNNEDIAKAIWAKPIRLNEAKIIKYFKLPGGEKVSAGMDITSAHGKRWACEYNQKTAADLFTANGVRVGQSSNTLWIKANQSQVQAEIIQDDKKITLALYATQESVLEKIRVGRTQSIEFLVTGIKGSLTSTTKIFGIITQVHTEKQVLKCANEHTYDKGLAYKFCPECGEPLK